jgi:hypothetical protein
LYTLGSQPRARSPTGREPQPQQRIGDSAPECSLLSYQYTPPAARPDASRRHPRRFEEIRACCEEIRAYREEIRACREEIRTCHEDIRLAAKRSGHVAKTSGLAARRSGHVAKTSGHVVKTSRHVVKTYRHISRISPRMTGARRPGQGVTAARTCVQPDI